MVTEKKRPRNFGSEANQLRKKRGAKDTEEVDQAAKTTKRQKLDRDLFSCGFDAKEKVPLPTKPVEEQRKSDQYSRGFAVPTPLSHEKALRAATIRIRFADTIVKAKYRKLIDESCQKADVMTRIEKERQLLEARQREEKARIEAEIRAPGLKLRHEVRLAIKKVEEEARSESEQDRMEAEKELVNLCGGSKMARTRWVESFGLFLKRSDDGLDEPERRACEGYEEGEII